MLRARRIPASPRIGLLWVLLASVALLPVLGDLALAHPLGNFTVNRYSRIEVGRDEVTLRYVLDLAEIPTVQELNAAGLDQQAPVAQVKARLLDEKVAQLVGGARLVLDGRQVSWAVRDRTLDLPEGQAGLRTLRLELTLASRLAVVDGAVLGYHDANYPDRIGWHEVVVRAGTGVRLDGSTVADRDASDELRSYPSDPARAPLDVSVAEARVRYGPAAARDPESAEISRDGARPFAVDAAAEHLGGFLRAGATGDVLALVAAFVLAAGIGAVHALTPGHGKTVMAAYLVGTRGTGAQAVLLGSTVAISHTVGVLGVAVLVLGAGSVFPPERIYPYASALSAFTVAAIGAWLLWRRPRRHAHAPSDDSGRDHDAHHGGDHRPDHGHGHGHAHRRAHDPATTAALGWRPLVALGMSGGLVPSASALLILLASMGLQRPDLGIVLVLAFGVGMACVLVGVGLALVAAGERLTDRVLGETLLTTRPVFARATALLPTATAGVVLLVGLALSVQALQQVIAAT